jgi:pyruvate dehydrogenase E1 component
MSAPQQTGGDTARESGAPRAVITDGLPSQLPDIDPDETQEWLDSLDAVVGHAGRDRARYLMLRLLERSREQQVGVPSLRSTDYINTIPPQREPWFPGNEDVERRIRAYIRWNAAIMVHRAQRPGIAVGGHISSYASSASTTSSAARTTPAAATRSGSRGTPPPASTPARSSRAG